MNRLIVISIAVSLFDEPDYTKITEDIHAAIDEYGTTYSIGYSEGVREFEELLAQLSESQAREHAAVEETEALLVHGFVGGGFNPCDLCEFSAVYHDDQPCVDCENSGSVRGNWKLASGPVAEKCDIAKYAESCEDCGFCEPEGSERDA